MAALTGAELSFLSSPLFGFDFAVGVTQQGINTAMKNYLASSSAPVISMCSAFLGDAFVPTIIPCSEVIAATGIDPFSFGNVTIGPSTRANTPANILALDTFGFASGYQAKIGLPEGVNPASLPDIVRLGAGADKITFNMYCSEFIVVELSDMRNAVGYESVIQEPSAPWLFSATVDLVLDTLTGSAAFAALPTAGQAQVKNLGSEAFSVQQLLFDLDNAGLETSPTISIFSPGSNIQDLVNQVFLQTYFEAAQTAGQPLLAQAVVVQPTDTSTLQLSDLNFAVTPYLGTNGKALPNPSELEQSLNTLNYLCATSNDVLPNPVSFGWNWVDESETPAPDGVVSINRNALAGYFESLLPPIASKNSVNVHVTVVANSDLSITYTWTLTSGQAPTVSPPNSTTGSGVLQYTFSSSSSDVAGLSGLLGTFDLSNTYTMDVVFAGTQINITQHVVWATDVSVLSSGSGSANIVDRTIVDTYNLAITPTGSLSATLTSHSINNDFNPSVNPVLNFFTSLNDLTSAIHDTLADFESIILTDIPISIVQGFVFPGGATFNFTSVGFSEHQDLVSNIKYNS